MCVVLPCTTWYEHNLQRKRYRFGTLLLFLLKSFIPCSQNPVHSLVQWMSKYSNLTEYNFAGNRCGQEKGKSATAVVLVITFLSVCYVLLQWNEWCRCAEKLMHGVCEKKLKQRYKFYSWRSRGNFLPVKSL